MVFYIEQRFLELSSELSNTTKERIWNVILIKMRN